MTAPTRAAGTETPLACPFCGTVPVVFKDSAAWTVACEGSDCEHMPAVVMQDTRDAAITAWNRRAPSPDLHAARAKALEWVVASERLPDVAGDYLCEVGAALHPYRVLAYEPSDLRPDSPWKDFAVDSRPFAHFIKRWTKLPTERPAK